MEEVDVMKLMKLFWRKKLLIIVLTLAGIMAGYIYNSCFIVPKYKAKATFLLSSADANTNTMITATEITLNSKIINNYTELVKSDTVLDKAINELHLKIDKAKLRQSINVNVKKDAEFTELTVLWEDPKTAKDIANKVIDILNEKVSEIYNIDNMHIVDYAKLPTSPENVNAVQYMAIFGACGLVLSIAIIFILQMMDDSVKDESDVEDKLDLPSLATFRKQSNPEQLSWNPRLDYVEGFKALRTNLQFSLNEHAPKTIAISSILPDAGKSWVTTNLAMVYAKADYKVLLIDADLRKGIQHEKFDIEQRPGFSDIIGMINNPEDEFDVVKDCIKSTEVKNLFVMPCGVTTSDSSELFLSNNTKKIIDMLKDEYDILLFDSTPSALVTDAIILSRMVDTNIIVAEYEKTKLSDLKKMKKSIQSVGGNIAGVVINKVDKHKDRDYYYYYYGKEKNMVPKKKHGRRDVSSEASV